VAVPLVRFRFVLATGVIVSPTAVLFAEENNPEGFVPAVFVMVKEIGAPVLFVPPWTTIFRVSD
jgi:hypothetical protein